MRNRCLPAVVFISFLFHSCATISSEHRFAAAQEIARRARFTMTTVKTNPFVLTAYYRISESGKPMHIYIEGDGYAWVTSRRVSGDPTPREPMLLSLAAEDPAANIVYLARPCQYTQAEKNPQCEEFYWTSGRFSEEVVRSVDQAVTYFVQKTRAPGVDLIGYSGGAAVAVLIAARRKDILSLRTIAGNLDPELVNKYHGVSPLKGSLNPLEVAEKLASLPQLHFIGGEDEVIPFAVAGSFLKKMGGQGCFQIKTISEASHNNGWVENWRELLEAPVICR